MLKRASGMEKKTKKNKGMSYTRRILYACTGGCEWLGRRAA